MRKTATKNSLLKAKAYKRNYHLDSGAVASSLSGFPSANNKQFQRSYHTSDQKSVKSKNHSISPGRKAEQYQALKNAEEFVKIEQESHRSRFSKNRVEGDD